MSKDRLSKTNLFYVDPQTGQIRNRYETGIYNGSVYATQDISAAQDILSELERIGNEEIDKIFEVMQRGIEQ